MPKSMTRVAVDYGGQPKEILSILERPNGDLVIFPRHCINAEYGDLDEPIISEKYSVHRSPASPGFTIKQTVTHSGAREKTMAQFKAPGPDGLNALVYVFCKAQEDRFTKHDNRQEELKRYLTDCKVSREAGLPLLNPFKRHGIIKVVGFISVIGAIYVAVGTSN